MESFISAQPLYSTHSVLDESYAVGQRVQLYSGSLEVVSCHILTILTVLTHVADI